VIIALGGASDPATGQPNTEEWADWHLWGAIGGMVLIAWTYFAAWNNVVAHQAIIIKLVADVAKIRHDRGLDRPTTVDLRSPIGTQDPS
jgi:hypothetical protein